uniref:ABC transporter permease n=1 Tax=candidate division WOR-3 bacterium TaxID=2052148 RepID=A0A7C4XU65_UNCW3
MRNRHLALFWGIFRKEWIELKRYPFNTISGVITVYLIFLLFFFGYNFLGGNLLSGAKTLEAFIVGFFIWTYAVGAYSVLAWGITQEARSGTLEQLYMTPLGYDTVAIYSAIASLFWNLAWVVPILSLMMITTGRFLHFDLITLIPLLILTIACGYGIGFIIAGLGLIFKKIQSFFQILQFIFVGFIALPVEKYPLFKLLPFTLGAKLIGKNMINKISIFQMNWADLLILLFVAFFYFALGFTIFKLCERVAKDKGLLGHY